MRYVSVFSGIEAASVAWEPLGWEPVAFCEIDAFPSAVLAERYPDVPNLGDITKVDWGEFVDVHGRPDVVVGGSPCQSFSIAGGRESLGGESRLMFEYIRAVQDLRPRWLLWENVPGVLNTRDNAFVQLLDSLQELGYGLAWRVLDAQFFGVAQRRRRVFLVGHVGGGAAPAAVLFEPESVSGNTQTSREKREELAERATERAGTGSECLTPWDAQSKRVFPGDGCAPTLCSEAHEGQGMQPSVLAFAQNTRDEVRIQGDGTISGALSATNGTKQTTYVIAIQGDGSTSLNVNGCGWKDDGSAYTLNTIDRQSVMCAENDNRNAVCMSSGQANAEICEGGGGTYADPPTRSTITSNGEDVFPSLCATDGDKQFIDNQGVNGGRLLLDPRREWP